MPAPTFANDAQAVELSLSFDVPPRPELTTTLEDRGTRTEDPSTYYQLGPVLVSDEHLALTVAIPNKDGSEVSFYLRLMRKPPSAPPQTVIDSGARVGGPGGLHALLTDVIAAAPAPPIGSFNVSFGLSAKGVRGPVPRPPHADVDAAIAPFGQALVESVGYRFTQSVGGIEEVTVTYHHGKRPTYRLRLTGRGPIKEIDSTFRSPAIVDACDLVLAHLFSESGEPDAEPG